MLRKRRIVALPIIAVMLVAGLLLITSNAGVSQSVQAAANQQSTFNIPTQMVPNNWPMTPSGLGAGDSFRLLFVTQGTTDGTTNGISRYNSYVADEAKKNTEFKEHMALSFRALVSVYQGLDARGNTLTRHHIPDPGHNSPIYWVKGDKVADSYADFYDGSWDSRVGRTSTGGYVGSASLTVHTGSTHEGTPANRSGWSLALGSPPAWWAFGTRQGAFGEIGTAFKDISGDEIYSHYNYSSDVRAFYGISPVLKIRPTTGPKPIIKGPTGKVTGPFDATITFPDDYQINYMELGDIQVSGGNASNLRGRNYTDAGRYGVTFTVTITPDYAKSVYDKDQTTVAVSMNAGAVSDQNGWGSVAPDAYTVKSSYVKTIPFDSDGVGTVPQGWGLISSTDLQPGDSFRLLFITSDTSDARTGDIAEYNGFVQSAAARNTILNGFSSRFRVLGSTSGVHALDNTGTRGTGVPIYWVKGAKVADNYSDFYDGSWDSRVGVDEQGRPLPRERDATRELWKTMTLTGTNNDGTVNSREPLGGSQVVATSLDRAWPFHAFTTLWHNKGHFYALSPVLKIAKAGGL